MSDPLSALARRHAARYATTPDEATRLVETTLARLDWRRRRGYKVCSACKEQKKPGDFGTDSARSDGLEPRCRSCRSVQNERRSP